MALMFDGASDFNGDISNWVTGNVTDMYSMFAGASDFNQPLNDWDTSKVTNMSYMFYLASSFNQPLNWNTSSVTNMALMFKDASGFNGDISNWITGNVTDMEAMFAGAADFNQDLNSWDVTNVTAMSNLLNGSGLSKANYDATLIGWSGLDVQSNITLGAAEINYCNGSDARLILTSSPNNWTINDAGVDCSTAGIDNQNQLDISIYPNPTSDMVYIESNYTQLKVVIYNFLGKEVMNKAITNTIDISHLDIGVYILQLSDGVKLSTRKIIKN
jgi:surface protein